MKKVLKVLNLGILVIMGVFVIGGIFRGVEASKLYSMTEITREDLQIESYMGSSITETESESKDLYYKVRRLSGPEYIGPLEICANEVVDITCTPGDAKILLMDEQGKQCFYKEITELHLEPGTPGIYDLYIIGKWYSGEVKISY